METKPLYIVPEQIKPDWTINSTNGFTLGKRYEVVTLHNEHAVTVLNDNGHERFVLVGCKSPHLVRQDIDQLGCPTHFLCGKFMFDWDR